MQKDPSTVQAGLSLAKPVKLGGWACAEEHTRLRCTWPLSRRSTGSMQPRLRKGTVWRLLEEMTAWRLLMMRRG